MRKSLRKAVVGLVVSNEVTWNVIDVESGTAGETKECLCREIMWIELLVV